MFTRKYSVFFLSLIFPAAFISIMFLLLNGIFGSESQNEIEELPINEPIENIFGFVDDSLIHKSGTVNKNETLSDILDPFYIEKSSVAEIAQISKKVFNVRNIRPGKSYHIYLADDSIKSLKYFVYEKDPIRFVLFDFCDSVDVRNSEKKVTIVKDYKSAEINSSLYVALLENDATIELAVRLSKIFAWQIDFYRLQKGDKFKVIYEKRYVDNKMVGIGKILGAYFYSYKKEYYAIPFVQDDVYQYFDENGNSLRKEFLKTPIEFARITSRYSSRRFHPVLKTYRPHTGIDYGAPTGTPIRTVGDGKIAAAAYSRSNGRYVKIRHNSVYSTMYLHMSRFGKGIKKGATVKQGQVIGFVGSTGLATGPHLHFNFLLNGRPVDPLKIEIPPSHPVKKDLRDEYDIKKKIVVDELQQMDMYVIEEQRAPA
jgi:murein DD-endopeptidase MepM/ murein hydrolase activator NlpD